MESTVNGLTEDDIDVNVSKYELKGIFSIFVSNTIHNYMTKNRLLNFKIKFGFVHSKFTIQFQLYTELTL